MQYAFCHIYNEALTDSPPRDNILFREALPESVEEELFRLFGDTGIDVTKSDLYNLQSGTLQMWEPLYNQPVYANAAFTGGETLKIQITFFTDGTRSRAKGRATAQYRQTEGVWKLVSLADGLQ
ncbi:hypothetical protein SDC9_210919 [bioreactor metagenome]|uniref:Uncharacterized protein n=1 Tax=bioreactor metagenome TaxID=1076179 RepID=A0A645JSY7_9ZZZZ